MLVLDAENRLRFRQVEILKTDAENVYILEGLKNGEQVCISPLEAAIDGMPVKPFDEQAANNLNQEKKQ